MDKLRETNHIQYIQMSGVVQALLSSYGSASTPASALASGWSTDPVNDEWSYRFTENGWPVFNKLGQPDSGSIWALTSPNLDGQWSIYDVDAVEIWRSTNGGFAYPWLVPPGAWDQVNGSGSAGTVRASTDVMRVVSDVVGASGDYEYLQFADGGNGPFPVYVKSGTDPFSNAISEADGTPTYRIYGPTASVLVIASDLTAFPDLATWPVGTSVGSPGQPFTETFTANGTWTCPTGVTSAFIACIGKGGNGFGTAGGGGGGGSYGGGTLAVMPATPYALTSFPMNAYFSSTVNFIGGNGGANGTSLTKGLGGTTVTLGASVTGGVTNVGGDGANGVVATLGGGGGGAGGSTGAGTNASGATHGNGNAPGGNGGDGAVGTADGSSGTTPGGGGGGALLGAGGTGGTARCQITYIFPE